MKEKGWSFKILIRRNVLFLKHLDILSVPGGWKGWTDKLAFELRKSYLEMDEIYAYCSVDKGKPLPVSTVESELQNTALTICDYHCLTLKN